MRMIKMKDYVEYAYNEVPPLEVNKRYDIVYVTTYEIEYLDNALLVKITPKLFHFEWAPGKICRVYKTSVSHVRFLED